MTVGPKNSEPSTDDVGAAQAPGTAATREETAANAAAAQADPAAGGNRRASFDVANFFQRYGVLIAFAVMVIFFCAERPSTFATLANLRDILSGSAALAVIAVALTVPMIMGDFDLSVGYSTQLLGAVVVTLMVEDNLATGWAILLTLAIGMTVTGLLGRLIAWSKVSSFVITLGAGILFYGIEVRIGHGNTISTGIPSTFRGIATSTPATFALPVWIAGAVAAVLWYVTEKTVAGRKMFAVGGNQEAARLSGIKVDRIRTLGFVIVGAGAAIAAVLITSQAASYFPSAATGLLIPAYASVFLGAAILRPGQFHILGTLIGVVFFQVIQVGLTFLGYAQSTSSVIQGAVFIAAVLISRVGARS